MCLMNFLECYVQGFYCEGTRRYGVPFFQVKNKIIFNVYY